MDNRRSLAKTQMLKKYFLSILNTFKVLLIYESINSFIVNTHKTLISQNIRSVPLYKSTVLSSLYLRQGSTDAIEITLYNAPIINTLKVEWKQILEIREDKSFSDSNYRNIQIALLMKIMREKIKITFTTVYPKK